MHRLEFLVRRALIFFVRSLTFFLTMAAGDLAAPLIRMQLQQLDFVR